MRSRIALVSVSDKTGVERIARALDAHGYGVLSTGGTASLLAGNGVNVTDVSDYTGFPEIMDGRVKTLHPRVHGGILARRDLPDHVAAMEQHGIGGIDMVVSNLYPFEATLASGADYDTCVENIDIGGPAMVRASAKNHDFVTIVTDPADYAAVEAEMTANKGAVSAGLRRRLAMTAFSHTAAYDAMIAGWLAREQGEVFPRQLTVAGKLKQTLRYGENPHQQAAAYSTGAPRPGVITAEQLQGKELSYNNLNDTNAAFELVAEFEAPTVAIIKHANPCGAAVADALADAYQRAFECDERSAFGGIVALSHPVDADTVERMVAAAQADVVIAPGYAAAQPYLDTFTYLIAGAHSDEFACLLSEQLGDRTGVAPSHGDTRKNQRAGVDVLDAIDPGVAGPRPDPGRRTPRVQDLGVVGRRRAPPLARAARPPPRPSARGSPAKDRRWRTPTREAPRTRGPRS